MPTWKKNIFVRVVRTRMEQEGRAAEEILAEYPALMEEEKRIILDAISQ